MKTIRWIAVGMVVLLGGAGVAPAAEREVLGVSWAEFQRQMALRNLSDSVRVSLVDGTEVKTRILRIEDDGLVVSHGKISREMIGRIRVNGRVGKRGLVGGLIGLGAGAGVTAGTWAYYQGVDKETGFYNTAATAILIPAGALAGYLIGRFSSRLAPEFVIMAADGRR